MGGGSTVALDQSPKRLDGPVDYDQGAERSLDALLIDCSLIPFSPSSRHSAGLIRRSGPIAQVWAWP